MPYRITPQDIDTGRHFCNMLDRTHEAKKAIGMEHAAKLLVQYAQKMGDWVDFTQKEVSDFFGHAFSLNDLTEGPNPLIRINQKDKTFSFTEKFITECYLASPYKQKK
ncbi:MAG: hypothetical protein Q8O83_00615 [bacterium]|nr:hypothetical protein [bacterium]